MTTSLARDVLVLLIGTKELRGLASSDHQGLNPPYLLDDGFHVDTNHLGHAAWPDILEQVVLP
jgi:hypothetical protein